MPDRNSDGPGRDDGFDQGFEEHRRNQIRRGLLLTPAERLRWLQRSVAKMRRLLGKARRRIPAGQKP